MHDDRMIPDVMIGNDIFHDVVELYKWKDHHDVIDLHPLSEDIGEDINAVKQCEEPITK